MSGNVFNIKSSVNVPNGLRNIARDFENGEYGDGNATLVIGSNIFHLGTFDEGEAFSNAVIDMQYGLSKLMESYSREVGG